jgi:hypothetical protein
MNNKNGTFFNSGVIIVRTFTLAVFKFQLAVALKRYLDVLLFLVIIISLILDLVYFCQSVVDHMTSFNYGDCALQMSSSTGTGTGTGGGSNLQGNSGFQNGSGGNGGNPGGLPGGNNEGIGSYTTERRIVHEDSSWSNTIRTLFINGSGG